MQSTPNAPPPTPTSSATHTSTPTLTPSPTLSASPTPAVTLSLRAAPAFVTPGGVLTLFWQIDNFSGGLEGLDLLFTVPPGITPIDLKSSIMTSGSAALLLPVTELQGKARFRVAEQAEGSFPLQADLLQDGMLLASATLTLTEEGLLLIPPSGVDALALGGGVKVVFPDEAVDEARKQAAPGVGAQQVEQRHGSWAALQAPKHRSTASCRAAWAPGKTPPLRSRPRTGQIVDPNTITSAATYAISPIAVCFSVLLTPYRNLVTKVLNHLFQA